MRVVYRDLVEKIMCNKLCKALARGKLDLQCLKLLGGFLKRKKRSV